MDFTIAPHSGFKPPADAIEQLWAVLGSARDEARFARRGADITATWGEDAPISMERDERADIGRRAILSIVRDVCETTPGISSDWYAVSVARR